MNDFDRKEYERLQHRKEALANRMRLDKPGPERDTALRLLDKVQEKLKKFEEVNNISHQTWNTNESSRDFATSSSSRFRGFGVEFDDLFRQATGGSYDDIRQSVYDETRKAANEYGYSTSDLNDDWDFRHNRPKTHWEVHYGDPDDEYYEDMRSEEEMIDDLGVIYLIFGSTYEIYLNYHTYRVRFLHMLDTWYQEFFRVEAMVYEENQRISPNIQIGFWPFAKGDLKVGDMSCSIQSGSWEKLHGDGYSRCFMDLILDDLKDRWNYYFSETILLPEFKEKQLISTSKNMNAVQRLNVIRTVEKRIKYQALPVQEKMKLTGETVERLPGNVFSAPIEKQKVDKMYIPQIRSFKGLEYFLADSGIVYLVTESDVLLYNPELHRYQKLINYYREEQFLVLELID